MNLDAFLAKIQEHNCITIYRHAHPDCDAFGSQFALKQWIKDNFPEKEVYALGYEQDALDQGDFPLLDQVGDEVVKNSLAIVLDTGNVERVDDLRFQTAKYIIKLDHHPNVTPFGDMMFVNDKAAATCEILTIFMSDLLKNYQISDETAKYLYQGILTDTLCFRTPSTTATTLKAASILANYNIDIANINRQLFDLTRHDFEVANEIRGRIQIDNNFAYVIISKDDLERWNMTPSRARNFIDEMGHVKEFQIWAMFTENPEKPTYYDGSLRSKTRHIHELAKEYHGGGHPCASGVKDLNQNELDQILKDLSNIANQ